MASSWLGRGDWLRSSAASVRTRMIGLALPPRALRALRTLLLLPLLPPRLPPRPGLLPDLPPAGGLSQPTDFAPFSSSSTGLGATDLRVNRPPRSRLRKNGHNAGIEAVTSARFISMPELTNPILFVASEKIRRLNSPWRRSTRRTTDVMVTLKG